MGDAFELHFSYINEKGFLRWVTRECVRANPFYVISAALLSYGAMLVNNEANPPAGKAVGIVLALVLLHLYELTVLFVATQVLKRRRGGGRDLHGLTIVAALFMSGSFLALDEMITIKPWLGAILVVVTLLLAYAKLEWYARQPGIILPVAYRRAGLLILASHAISSLLGAAELHKLLSRDIAQPLGWACGWVSMLVVFRLAWSEQKFVVPNDRKHPPVETLDPLVTRVCGGWMLGIFTLMGLLHLIASDWVFDRTYDKAWLLPELSLICGILVVLRWTHMPRFSPMTILLAGIPVCALDWLWGHRSPWALPLDAGTLLSIPWQMSLACLVMYLLLVRATQRWEFYICAAFALFLPGWTRLWLIRGLPYFRGLFMAALGFVALMGGMCVSLYRERLLRWLENGSPTDKSSEVSLP